MPLYLLLPDVAKGIWVLHLTPHDGNPTPWIYWRFPSDSDSKVHSDVNTTSCHSASDKQKSAPAIGKKQHRRLHFHNYNSPLVPTKWEWLFIGAAAPITFDRGSFGTLLTYPSNRVEMPRASRTSGPAEA